MPRQRLTNEPATPTGGWLAEIDSESSLLVASRPSSRSGHSQHVRLHQQIRALRQLLRRQNAVRVGLAFELCAQAASGRCGRRFSVVNSPPPFSCSDPRTQNAI
jgi:hypothetical protein